MPVDPNWTEGRVAPIGGKLPKKDAAFEDQSSEEKIVQYTTRENIGQTVPTHVVVEQYQQGKLGGVREVAWFWENSDAEEYKAWKASQS